MNSNAVSNPAPLSDRLYEMRGRPIKAHPHAIALVTQALDRVEYR
jgi:hypothetical protein